MTPRGSCPEQKGAVLKRGLPATTKQLDTLLGGQSHSNRGHLAIDTRLNVVGYVPQHRGWVLVGGRLDLPDYLEVWLAHALSTDPLRT